MTDALTRFMFDQHPIRGAIVQLDEVVLEILKRHNYPPVIQKHLIELVSASALLSSTLKFEGSLILQIAAEGLLRLMVVECSNTLNIRAIAQWGDANLPQDADLLALTGKQARFVLTVDPKDGSPMYQGIIPIEGGSIAAVLEDYLTQSEQLESRMFLGNEGTRAGGLLLQRLPGQTDSDAATWHEVNMLASTVKTAELSALSPADIVQRLFAEYDIRLFESRPAQFYCPCNVERVANAVRMLGETEAQSLLEEQGEIEVHCEFCNKRYAFDASKVAGIFHAAKPNLH